MFPVPVYLHCVLVIVVLSTCKQCFDFSFLRSLVPVFNECVDQFLKKLRPLADGQTQVPMKDEFSSLTLHIISKVWELIKMSVRPCMWGFDLVHDIVIATFPGSIMHRQGTVKCSLGTIDQYMREFL